MFTLFVAAPGMPPEQAADADLVAVWGNNVTDEQTRNVTFNTTLRPGSRAVFVEHVAGVRVDVGGGDIAPIGEHDAVEHGGLSILVTGEEAR